MAAKRKRTYFKWLTKYPNNIHSFRVDLSNDFFWLMDVVFVLVKRDNSYYGKTVKYYIIYIYLEIWAYFERNYGYGNIHYVEIPIYNLLLEYLHRFIFENIFHCEIPRKYFSQRPVSTYMDQTGPERIGPTFINYACDLALFFNPGRSRLIQNGFK